MITLNDYLYSGDTVLKILHCYASDLRKAAAARQNPADMAHSSFLLQMTDLLEHNDFLTSQSQRIHELYKYMAREYPFLSFTFKGRIKSLIRSEEKFNGRLISSVNDHYKKHRELPEFSEISRNLFFRDLIAYRIVISLPRCHVLDGSSKLDQEIDYLYELAEVIPGFLREQGFSIDLALWGNSSRLSPLARPYYKDFIEHPTPVGYQSLHIIAYDKISRSHFELQLRTKEMDDYAEIGFANHAGYEKLQNQERTLMNEISRGKCVWYDEACAREELLRNIDLAKVDVDMFAAANNMLINDGCGLFRGRQITPFEHLSRFQKEGEN